MTTPGGLKVASASQVLATSHGMTSRVTAFLPGGGIAAVRGLSSGSVTFDSSQNIRRTASLTFAPLEDLWPYSNVAALSVLGSELFIEYGIVLPDSNVVWVPLMRGPIQTVTRTVPAGTNGIAVTVSDRAQNLAEDRLPGSRKIPAGTVVTTAATQLIQETFPGVPVTDLTGTSVMTPAPIDVQQDRLGGVANLLLAAGAVMYTARDGGFVFAPQATIYDSSKWTFASGKGGTLIKVDEALDRAQVFNAVTASGQTSDNSVPASATVYDTDGASPTVYGGPFGRKTRQYTSPLLSGTEQCRATAQAILEKARGNQTKLSITCVPNPYIDVDDACTAVYRGSTYVNLIDSTTIPLTPNDSQTIKTRGVVLPAESDNLYDLTAAPASATPTAAAT